MNNTPPVQPPSSPQPPQPKDWQSSLNRFQAEPVSPLLRTGPKPGYEQQWYAYQQTLKAAQNPSGTVPVAATTAIPAATQLPFQPYAAPPTQPAALFTRQPLPAKGKKRTKTLIAALAVVIAGAAGIYVFAFYLPGRPENVWNAGLGTTGLALSQLNSEMTASSSLNKLSKYAVDGTFSATIPADAEIATPAITLSGSVAVTADATKTNADIKGTAKNGGASSTIELHALANQGSDSSYPDSYVQVTGLTALGLGAYLPGINQYDGKWISVPASYIQDMLGTDTTSTSQAVSSADVAAFTSAVTKVVNRDVLTSDPSQSILQRKSFVGHETKGGRNNYHYTATINKDRAATFCTDLSGAVVATTLYKKLADDSKATDIAKSCSDAINQAFPPSKTLDVWIDSTYHVLTAIRFNPGTKSGEYEEIGETLGDLNKPSVYVTGITASGNTTMTATVDRSTFSSTFDLDSSDTAANGTTTVKAHLTIAPYSGNIVVTPPTGSTDIRDIITQYAAILGISSDTASAAPIDSSTDTTVDNSDTSSDPPTDDTSTDDGDVTDANGNIIDPSDD